MVAKSQWIQRLFEAVDQKDTERFISFLADDAVFTFGNAEPVEGKATVGETVKGFFDSVKGLSHRIDDVAQVDDLLFCRGKVTYTRHDGSQLSVPFANAFRMQDQLVREYQIYVDASQLYG